MNARALNENVRRLGAVDWDRRLFDALIPLPEGTSYNAYLVRGSERTALLDTCEPARRAEFLAQLDEVDRLDYVVLHHAEQDHSGLLPEVLERFPDAVALASPKGAPMLADLLPIPSDRIRAVADNETLELGGRALRFLHLPWVHWPETMTTWLEPDGILFSCDMFGAHLATSDLFARDSARALAAAKLYYAQIMMPYARQIERHLVRLAELPIRMIAPSHGPVFDRPALIFDAWREWVSGPPRRRVVLPRVSMHGSTEKLSDALIAELTERGVAVEPYDLAAPALDRLAASLVNAGAVVFAAPAVWNGPHPAAAFAAAIVNGLKPNLRCLSWIGSYGWGEKALAEFGALCSGLKAEILPPVLCRGRPRPENFSAIRTLAEALAARLPAE